MTDDIIDDVYTSLQGLFSPGYEVPWVENAFTRGSFCTRAYADMLNAYERLCDRLEEVDEDRDVEVIIRSLLGIQQVLCRKMFEYGQQYQRMQEEQSEGGA